MKTALIKIPADLFALAERSRFSGELELDTLEIGPDEYRFDQPVAWEAEITNTGEAFLVEGTARATGATSCARCLEDVSYDLEGAIEGYFLINPEETGEPEDLEDDEFEVLPKSHEIDLAPQICGALIMAAPDVPLCKEDCLGLCPHCGANLNEGPCGCTDEEEQAFEEAKNPFAVLKDFDFGEDAEADGARNTDDADGKNAR